MNSSQKRLQAAILAFAALGFFLGIAARASDRPESRGTTPAALSPDLVKVFDEGVQAQKAGDLEAAEKAFLKVLNAGGRAAFVYNNLGIVYMLRGDYLRAIQQFREAARRQPDYPAPRVLLGSSLLLLGRIQEATKELEGAVMLAPRDPLARLQLAKAYKRTGKLLNGADQLRALRKLAPQEPEYLFRLGRAYLELSTWSYLESVRHSPQSARVHQTLAENYRAQRRPELAAKYFQLAAQANPKLPEIHLALAEIYLEEGNLAEARKEVEKELAVMPESMAASRLKKSLDSVQVQPDGEPR